MHRIRKRKARVKNHNIPLLNPEERDAMRAVGKLAAEILDRTAEMIAPGITTEDIDRFVDEMTGAAGAISAPLGYHGFPKHCCTSINEVVCHGIPEEGRVLLEGDIINVDVTPILGGFHGDSSRTFFVGEVAQNARDLVDTTYEALWIGIRAIGPGVNVRAIGRAIQPFVKAKGYSIVRDYTGHGLGRTFHCEPQVLHHVSRYPGVVLEPGMALTIEPMINMGQWQTRTLKDGWTAITPDGALSAQFEHSLLITEDGVEVLTLGAHETPPAR